MIPKIPETRIQAELLGFSTPYPKRNILASYLPDLIAPLESDRCLR